MIDVIPRAVSHHMEPLARRRLPPNDWPPVALALDVGILTNDHDFLG